MRRQEGCDRVYGPGQILPRRLLFRQGETLRRRTLVRGAARLGRRSALQTARFTRTDHDQYDQGYRRSHQQRRSYGGYIDLPRQQMGGAGAESAVLPLRGNLPQIPQPQPRRPRCELLPRSGCQGRPRNHRKGPLQALSDRTPRKGLPDALRPEGRQSRRVHSGYQVRLRDRRAPQRIGLYAAADAGTASPASSSIPI